jgi:hypothetical protein
MEPAAPGVAAYIGRWQPSSVSSGAAVFARDVIAKAAPRGRERAKCLLWAVGKLADYGLGLGLEPVPEVLLHPSVTERFTRCAPGLSPVARRTLRTNLRFIGRRVVPQLYPADLPLPRERAKTPYTAAEIAGFLALADAQPTAGRRMRAAGLVCLGAGAGLICGGADPGRRNITNPLVTALDGGSGLARLDTSRLRATWLAGMCLAQAGHRPAHLTRVHQALIGLPEDQQRRLGVTADWKHGPHRLTYRQIEYTFGRAARALAKDEPGGLPSPELQAACDQLLEASVPEEFKGAGSSLAVDWTDLESFSRHPPAKGGPCADPEASWGHRKNNLLRSEDELFYGYYLSAGTMAREENGPAVPELARRATVSSCRHDPVRAFAPVLTAMPGQGTPLGDILADSGYSHRDAAAWAIPLRAAGAQLVQDLHPHDRGPRGTHHGAIIANGSLLPVHTSHAAGTGTAGPHRQQRADHGLGTPDRRTRPPQARPPHRRRPRRLPPGPVPRRHGQDPLPAAARLDDPGPGPARDPAAPGPPPGLLHAADDHRPARRERQNQAETRLPVRGLAPLLRPPHRRRTRLRHRQGPRHQRHQPRLVPPDGPVR